MQQPEIKYVHFDMDGIIANTEPLHVEAEQQTCRDYNFDIDPEDWNGFKGRTANDIFQYLIDNYGDPTIHEVADLINHKTDVFLELADTRLEPIDGVLDFIDWTQTNYNLINLVTSSNRRVQEFILGRFGLTNTFNSIVTGDDISNGKPHPEPYLRAIELSGSHPGQSVVVEDSKSGIESGLAAGCRVLAMTTSHPYEEIQTAEPTFIAQSYPSARQILESRM